MPQILIDLIQDPWIRGIGCTFLGGLLLFFITKNKNEENISSIVSNKFFTLGKKYKILAVHQYKKENDAISGYTQLRQNSRPDQWKKLIKIKSIFFDLKHEIIPINPKDILTVVISRNGKENWKSIEFNK
jgi:hypothetical protein